MAGLEADDRIMGPNYDPRWGAPGRNPTMPEEFDRPEALGSLTPHLRAFGAGVVDPMGLPSWFMEYLSRHGRLSLNQETADWYRRRMQEARDESPMAAGLGSAVVPALAGGAGLVGLGELTGAEFLSGLPHALGIGGAMGGMRSALWPPEQKRRPQAAYPPSGAY